MTSHRVREFFLTKKQIEEGDRNCTPVSPQKVVNSCGYCMGIQCFTVERLRADKRGPDRMDSLTELEHVLETLDMTRVEEEKIARILERLRDELNAAS